MDNPEPAPTAPFALSGFAVIRLEGRDALSFAQAQTMNDVAALADGHWHWNGWLTPKGRVIALFALLRLDAERFWLVVPDAEPQALVASLQRFVFRSKLQIAIDGSRAEGRFAPPVSARGNTLAELGEGKIELDMGVEGGPRSVLLHREEPATDRAAAERWRAFDLAHGLPRLDASQAEHWTPQQLSLERLRAYSVKKGCYPGQEIVARTHFLGKAKRGLALLGGSDAAQPGDPVMTADAGIGSVVSVAGDLALAVLPLERDLDEALVVGTRPVQVRPLLGGLAR